MEMTILLGVSLAVVMLLSVLLYRKSTLAKQQMAETQSKLEETKQKIDALRAKYAGVIEADEYRVRVTKEADEYRARTIKEADSVTISKRLEKEELEALITGLQANYATKRTYLAKLIEEIALYEEQQEVMSYGLYAPHFDFDTSEQYKDALVSIREKQKAMVRAETAATCRTDWTVNGSATEGKKQTKQCIRLALRAFNGECEALIADVRWNNAVKMEERLNKAFEAINKLCETQTVTISPIYRDLKMDELRLAHERQEKLRNEKEEQKRIQEQIREEERAQKEIERALKDTDADEKRYSKALDQARSELQKLHGEALDKATARLAELEQQLEEAQRKKERALSMAQQTKAGHVYVISNIGSFGENVFKIGMTRRLEPIDRVRELGDASVPFEFDVHALIYSENAPELENLLHKQFDTQRVNLLNTRKEFFNVSLGEIERAVKSKNANIEFTQIAEARDYRESVSIRTRTNVNLTATKLHTVLDEMPESI